VHETSLFKMAAIREEYAPLIDRGQDAPVRVLDVGAMAYQAHDSYRSLFEDHRYKYVGLDIAPGPNVDLVPVDPYSWSEIEDESFDLVISGQSFEHNPFFWITWAEIARVLRIGGVAAIIAPSAGFTHRYPLDCWRFYPDAWTALSSYAGLELVEHYVETDRQKVISGVEWQDSVAVARKPEFASDQERSSFYDRLHRIVATRSALPQDVDAGELIGPAIQTYEATYSVRFSRLVRHHFAEKQFVHVANLLVLSIVSRYRKRAGQR